MITKILSLLTNVHQSGHKYRCTCPSHGSSKNQGLMVFDHGDKVGIHCFAGCHIDEILGAIGLQAKDLYQPIDKDEFRQIIAEKRRQESHDRTQSRLYSCVCTIQQCIEARMFDGDKTISGLHEAWDREKQAVRLIHSLLKEYYK